MSGINILVDGQFGIDMVDYAPAVTFGLVDIKFPRISAQRTIKDWYDGPDSSIVGSPIYSQTFANLKSNTNYIQSPNEQTTERTIFAVIRSNNNGAAANQRPVIAGNFNNSVSGFYIGLDSVGGNLGLVARRVQDNAGSPQNGVLASLAISAGQANNFRVVALVMDFIAPNYGIQIFDMTANTQSTKITSTLPPVFGGNIRYGSDSGGESLGDLDMAVLFDYNVALSSTERTQVYEQIKAFLAEESTPIIV